MRKMAKIFMLVVLALLLGTTLAFAKEYLTGNEYEEAATGNYAGWTIIKGHKYNADIYFRYRNGYLEKEVISYDGKDLNEAIWGLDLGYNTERYTTRGQAYAYMNNYRDTHDNIHDHLRLHFGSIYEDWYDLVRTESKGQDMIDLYLINKSITVTLSKVITGTWVSGRTLGFRLDFKYDGTVVTGTSIYIDNEGSKRYFSRGILRGSIISDKEAEFTIYNDKNTEIGKAIISLRGNSDMMYEETEGKTIPNVWFLKKLPGK